MKVGLVGFAASGKSTLFSAISRGSARDGIASVPAPDDRLNRIVAIVKPKKVVSVHIEWHDDLPDPQTEDKPSAKATLSAAREMDALVVVLRLFDTPFAPFHSAIDPSRDLRFFLDEFALSDLQAVENRIERLHKQIGTHREAPSDKTEMLSLERIMKALNSGKSVADVEASNEDRQRLASFSFLTQKPVVVAANVPEGILGRETSDQGYARLAELCTGLNLPLVALSATFEHEHAMAEEHEKAEYLELVGLSEARLESLQQSVFGRFGKQLFYTVGDDTRSWPLPIGGSALEAAGIIHSDLARGFIRAEVCHYEDFVECGGWQPAHHAGRTKLEGREYRLKDGDVINIRFKV